MQYIADIIVIMAHEIMHIIIFSIASNDDVIIAVY